jgi:hypothetical protein
VKLVFSGTSIQGLVDGTQVFSVTNATYARGSVGLGTAAKTTALFDNLIVNTVGGAKPAPTVFPQDGQSPPDGGSGPDVPILVADSGARDVAAGPDSGNRDAGVATDSPVSTGGTGGATSGTGGVAGGTGGATGGTGGATGGTTGSTGGATGSTGGTTGTTGGTSSATGGNGGAIAGNGGSSGTGGKGGAGGASTLTPTGKSGCSCNLGSRTSGPTPGGIVFFLTALVVSALSRARRKNQRTRSGGVGR